MDHNRIRLFITFVLRHFIASIISVVAAILLAIVVYFVLLIIAIVRYSDMGGPLALPLFIAIAGIASLFYTTCLLFPSVLIAELISQRFRNHQLIAQALISTIIQAILVFILTFGIHQISNYEKTALLNLADYPVQIFLVLLLPLGFYWWTTKTIEAIAAGIIALWK